MGRKDRARRRTRRIEAERLTTLTLLALFLYPFLSLSSPFLHSLTHSLTLSLSRADGRTATIAAALAYVNRGEVEGGRGGGGGLLLRGGTAVYYRHLASRQRRRRHVVRSTRVVNVNAMTACTCVCVSFLALSRLSTPAGGHDLLAVSFRFVSFRSVPFPRHTRARTHARTHDASRTRARTCVCVCVSYARSTRCSGPFSRFSFSARAPSRHRERIAGSFGIGRRSRRHTGEAECVARASSALLILPPPPPSPPPLREQTSRRAVLFIRALSREAATPFGSETRISYLHVRTNEREIPVSPRDYREYNPARISSRCESFPFLRSTLLFIFFPVDFVGS